MGRPTALTARQYAQPPCPAVPRTTTGTPSRANAAAVSSTKSKSPPCALRDAAARGEARPESVTRRIAKVGPRLVIMESWERGHVAPDEVVAIVDEILIPLTGAAA